MTMSMAASHAANRKLTDAIFEANAACKDAVKKFGAEKVTNATIGTVLDDGGKLIVLPTVEKVWREMEMQEFMSYAPISGLKDYQEAIKGLVFDSMNCKSFFSSDKFRAINFSRTVSTIGNANCICVSHTARS